MSATSDSVKVALRIRPQLEREQAQLARVCTSVCPGAPQVLLGEKQAFTFDQVYDQDSRQASIFEDCVRPLVDASLDGYNATILAYGQTGSGKTFTMGTATDNESTPDQIGVIPRAVSYLFSEMQMRIDEAREKGMPEPVFETTVEFIELYNDDVLDLLDSDRDPLRNSSSITIRETEGRIFLNGVSRVPVKNTEETMRALREGALCRTTASTNMNLQSSRSHAIFTIHVRQQRHVKLELNNQQPGTSSSDENDHADGHSSPDSGLANSMAEFEVLSSKFHFVDLAGSERMKRTGATGDRAKEAININKGLLALGNVISALGDSALRAKHIPYRDSKLTRLMQDSLGGNSKTLMIACISPSDCDFCETLNTLNYANRAKNIKNEVSVNQDSTSRVISELRQQIQNLSQQLNEFKQGKRLIADDGSEMLNDQYSENVLLQSEVEQLRIRVKAMQETNDVLQEHNVRLMAERDVGRMTSDGNDDMTSVVQKYLTECESLRSALCESQSTSEHYRRQLVRMRAQCVDSANVSKADDSLNMTMNLSTAYTEQISKSANNVFTEVMRDTSRVISEAKQDVEKLKTLTQHKQTDQEDIMTDSMAEEEIEDESMDGDDEDGDETETG